MPELVWDKVGERVYESGLDKGVLYLPDGSAVAWNGLTSVIEKNGRSTLPVYYDGMKIQDQAVLGDFSATMKALTYPDEFIELEGVGKMRAGVFLGDQVPKVFGLCYRTRIGDDVSGEEVGFKLHVIYNVTAIPSDKSYLSASDQPHLVEFEWTLTAVPEETPGFRPTAHIVFDLREFDPLMLAELEAMFYGSSTEDAVLLPMADLISFVQGWRRVRITDNGDGTWTATTAVDEWIQLSGVGNSEFQITHANAVFLDPETFEISDTFDISDDPDA